MLLKTKNFLCSYYTNFHIQATKIFVPSIIIYIFEQWVTIKLIQKLIGTVCVALII